MVDILLSMRGEAGEKKNKCLPGKDGFVFVF